VTVVGFLPGFLTYYGYVYVTESQVQ